MKLTFATAYPFWFLILCLLAGAFVAWVLYFSGNRNNTDIPPRLRWILAVLRGVATSLIAFLLLSPLLQSNKKNHEKPVVIFALDNSESIISVGDSGFYKNDFKNRINKLKDKLDGKFEVIAYNFSDSLRQGSDFTYFGKQTDMSLVFNELKNNFSNRNVAALILSGDGIYTRGNDPVYEADEIPYSIYTIACGDTTRHKDLVVGHVGFNRTAYQGNTFPVEVALNAYHCSGETVKVSISGSGKVIASENVSISQDDFSRIVRFQIPADKIGMQRYRVTVTEIAGEINRSNNSSDFVVEVLNAKLKVLIAAASPHPDIAALRQALEQNGNYEVELSDGNTFKEKVNDYALVVLHQLPSTTGAGFSILNQLKTSNTSILYILGSQSALPAFNQLSSGVIIPPASVGNNDAYALVNSDFKLFSLSDDVLKSVIQFPPLSSPFGNYKTGTSTEVLFKQRIGNVSTNTPLILFNQDAERKSCVIAGEGLWRWRLDNFMQSNNHNAFDELITKITQFLSVRSDKSRFRVFNKGAFNETDAVVFDAELYNKTYELVNEPEVTLNIVDEENKQFNFAMGKTMNAYTLNTGTFAPGEYTYKASTTYGGENFVKSGIFTVSAVNIEHLNTVANQSLLYSLAKKHNGEMVYPADMMSIADKLLQRNDLKTIVHTEKRFSDLVNVIWVLLVIVALLATEWFLRKRNGSY
jgi:hypothetical protein